VPPALTCAIAGAGKPSIRVKRPAIYQPPRQSGADASIGPSPRTSARSAPAAVRMTARSGSFRR